ncbi:MAG TPA: NAD(P)/FAD-dependent oxidoreductase [Candidatus Paceibacterota bacterium]
MKAADHYDVAVIGGGPAGMMAALRAAERGKSVVLLEKNTKLGKKLDITGGGRCNITNAEFDKRAFLKHYGSGEKFLHSPLSQFSVQDTFDLFTTRGLPLVVEARKRAFPATHRATDVTKTLEKYLQDAGVAVRTRTAVSALRAKSGRIMAAVYNGGTYTADSFIIATGGMSHPETGSTGDGFRWLAEMGHTVRPASPSIVPLKMSDAWVKKLAGTTIENVKIIFFCEGKRAFSKAGPLLFTHFGLSGPMILNSAAQVGDLLLAGDVTCAIDLFPEMDFPALDKKILAAIDAGKNRQLINVLPEIVPRGVANAVLALMKVGTDTKAHSFPKEDRRRLVHLLKAMQADIIGLMGFDRAVVSDGGVILEEVDTRTMRSRIISNLYLIGDVLHISRPSGGYSLQLCWTTGYVAGNAV